MGGRQREEILSRGPDGKEVSGEKRQIASAFAAFTAAEFCPKNLISRSGDTKFKAHIALCAIICCAFSG